MAERAADRFDALWHAHHRAVLRYLARRHPQMAGDLCADVFAVVWRRLDDVPGDPLPWLLAIARNTLRNQLRLERRHTRLLGRLGQEPAGVSVDELGQRLDANWAAALETLSARDRELIALLAWEELTPDEAATVLGTTRGAVAVRLHRIRTRLAGLRTPTPTMKGTR